MSSGGGAGSGGNGQHQEYRGQQSRALPLCVYGRLASRGSCEQRALPWQLNVRGNIHIVKAQLAGGQTWGAGHEYTGKKQV